jgi:hypothetical protein
MLEAPSLANAERGREIERYERAGERDTIHHRYCTIWYFYIEERGKGSAPAARDNKDMVPNIWHVVPYIHPTKRKKKKKQYFSAAICNSYDCLRSSNTGVYMPPLVYPDNHCINE